MKFRFFVLRGLVDCLLAVIMIIGYFYGRKLAVTYVADIFLITTIFSITGVMVAIRLTSFLKNSVFWSIKVSQLYSISTGNKAGILASYAGAVARFKCTVSVPVLNKVLRTAIDSMFSSLTEGENKIQLNENFNKFIEVIGGNFLVKIGNYFIKKELDYLDECVMCYCYKNKDVKLLDAITKALGIIIHNTKDIFEKIFTATIITWIINVIVQIVSFVLYLKVTGPFGVTTGIQAFIFSYCVKFIIEDALLEPLLMMTMVNLFNEFPEKDEEIDIKNFVPGMEDLIKILKGSNG